MECMGVCMFPLYQRIPLSKWKDLYEAATGVSTTVEGLFRNSENLWDARRAFGLREGLSARDDGAPRRFLEEEVPAGDAVHAPLGEEDFRRLIHDYYEERGWHRNTGAVRPDRLRELGLTWDCLPGDPG
jgi:aldehyde:ferredoxin oxidoreductase